MHQHHQLHRRIFAILCIFLILSYACVFFLPYEHDCINDGCAICALVDAARYTLAGLLLAFIAGTFRFETARVTCTSQRTSALRDDTPVAKKVKLSN